MLISFAGAAMGLLQALREAVKAATAGIDATRIGGIGVSGQQHGMVLLDEEFQVIRNAKLWCDVEAAKEAEEISRQSGVSYVSGLHSTDGFFRFSIQLIISSFKPAKHRLSQLLFTADPPDAVACSQQASQPQNSCGLNATSRRHGRRPGTCCCRTITSIFI